MKNNIPFSPPFVDQDVIVEVLDSLNSGWITSGPKVKEFEDEISKLTNAEKCVCVNSWTSGAILTLKWFGIKEGDEVIIPAYTYSATALAVLHCGAIPVMVDVNEDFSINVELIRKKISSKTKIIMPVDFAGLPCDYEAIYRVVNSESVKSLFIPNSINQKRLGRIIVISDAAHSVGAEYKGIQVGKLADITILSFHAVKNITTAEGGAICINLPKEFDIKQEYNFMKLFSLNGQNKDALEKSKVGGWKYDILFAGIKVNMPDICAAIGLAQIRKYKNNLLIQRRRIALRYKSFFEKYPFFQLPVLEDHNRISCFHLFALRINKITELQRDEIINQISNLGVSVNVHFIPMPMLTLFKELGYNILDYPVSYDNYSREISLPIYPQLSNDQIDYICESVLQSYFDVIQ